MRAHNSAGSPAPLTSAAAEPQAALDVRHLLRTVLDAYDRHVGELPRQGVRDELLEKVIANVAAEGAGHSLLRHRQQQAAILSALHSKCVQAGGHSTVPSHHCALTCPDSR